MNALLQNIIAQQIPPQQRILIAPLNWGLGHAVRCIPVIQSCLNLGHEVVIATDGLALQFLRDEFPQLTYYTLPSYDIKYPTESMIFNLIMQSPKFFWAVIQERKETQKIIEISQCTTIISDNRLGVFHKRLLNIYMTHQYHILNSSRWISFLGSKFHQSLFRRFEKVWIPDFCREKALAPRLSSTLDKRVSYLGLLTTIKVASLPKIYDVVIILSGPEPQRTFLEKALLDMRDSWRDVSLILVRGTEKEPQLRNVQNHIKIINVASRAEIENLLNRTKILVARSGYTTVMDVHAFDIEKIWIPTPGQTEQEYLAQKLVKNLKNHFLEQKNINTLQKIIRSLLK